MSLSEIEKWSLDDIFKANLFLEIKNDYQAASEAFHQQEADKRVAAMQKNK